MPQDAQISSFLAKYTPEIAAQLHEARLHLAGHFPRGFELVYDNYNALVFAFASSDRASGAILSVAAYPRWIALFFAHGASLPDPAQLLEGSGARIRSVRLQPPTLLYEPEVQVLIVAAKAFCSKQLDGAPVLSTMVKAASAKQRARKPAAEKMVQKARYGRAGATEA
jgi:hypothetical protein